MARDKGLEELLAEDLQTEPGLTGRAMFGGWAWLLDGHLLCGARHDGMLVRLGKGSEDWALAKTGIAPMLSRGRPMGGWIRADQDVCGDDALRRALLAEAVAFVHSLPPKTALSEHEPGLAGIKTTNTGPMRRKPAGRVQH